MTANTLDPVLAAAIRQELIATGTKTGSLVRQQRRIRVVTTLVGGVALVGAVTGAALIVAGLPGQTITAPFGVAVTATHTGTASIDLGPAPHNASVVSLDITCLSAGTYSVPLRPSGGTEAAGSVTADCTKVGIGHTTHINNGLLPAEGSTSITITADAGTAWKATARYASQSTSVWGVNANGQTYGVANDEGVPDLTAAQATNGKIGYIYNDELFSQSGSRYLNVYESDGVTVIGKFPLGIEGE